MDHRNQGIVGENCVHNDADELALTDKDKKAWIEHYARLLNVEFVWPSNELPEAPLTAGLWLQQRNNFTLPSQTLRKPSIVCPGHVLQGPELCGPNSEEFGMGVGVHQGSVLSPLLFILVLEALSREFCTGVPWEFLYADDHRRHPRGVYLQAQGTEGWQRTLCQHEEDQVPSLWWWPGCPPEIWQVPLCCLL